LRYPTDEIVSKLQEGTNPDMQPETLLAFVNQLQMPARKSFVVPTDYVSAKVLANGWKSGRPATAVTSGMTWRRRSGEALRVVAAGWRVLPRLPVDAFYGLETVRAKMESVVLVSGGTQHTLGRLEQYYPRSVGVTRRLEPPSTREVLQAMTSCGLTVLREQALIGLPVPLLSLNPPPGERGVKVNPRASNGFPNLGKWSDDADRDMVLRLASECRALVLAAYDKDPVRGVSRWVHEMMETRPYLVAVQGKCKADYYSMEKVLDRKLRFYNVLPRHLTILMQQATQQLEAHSRNALDDAALHTAQGVGLVRGGADRLVAALEAQLSHLSPRGRGYAYLHVGDDSWVAVRWAGKIALFALDCSSFDLTQHSAVTQKVHGEVYEMLREMPGGAPWGQLWHTFMRERLTVLAGAATVVMTHGGPSGAPLQSKVNDLLMDILLQRVVGALDLVPDLDSGSIGRTVEVEGARLGFSVRLEQYYETEDDGVIPRPIVGVLIERPFLFVGYYFHVLPIDGAPRVVPFCDLARTMAQMRYPGIKWTARQGEFEMMEAARLAATVSNMGIPPVEAREAYEAMRDEALLLLGEAVRRAGAQADAVLSQLGFVTGDPVAAEGAPALSTSSLRGLQKYLGTRQNEAVWGWQPAHQVPIDEASLMREVDAILGLPLPAEAIPSVVVPQLPRSGFLLIRRPNGSTVEVASPAAGVRPMTARNFARPPPTSNVTNEELLKAKKIGWAERDARRANRRGTGDRSREEATAGNEDYAAHKSRGKRRFKSRK